MAEKMIEKFTLKAFVIITGWIFLLLAIAYAMYEKLELIDKSFDVLLGSAITIINVAIARWLFGEGSK